MKEEKRLNCTVEEMEKLIETMMWFWGNLHQRWRMSAEKEYGVRGTVKLEMDFIGDIGGSHARGLKRIFKMAGGIPGLMEAFRFLPENFIEPFELVEKSDRHVVLRNSSCTVQKARLKKGGGDYPCREPAVLYFQQFAREIDPEIRMVCEFCPPDPDSKGISCQWRFETD